MPLILFCLYHKGFDCFYLNRITSQINLADSNGFKLNFLSVKLKFSLKQSKQVRKSEKVICKKPLIEW